MPAIYENIENLDFENGFYELAKGDKICLISTGYMTHRALNTAKILNNIGVIDIFMLKSINENSLFDKIKNYKYIITIEEGFIGNGGLDSLVSKIILDYQSGIRLKRFGINDKYVFELGDRNYLHKLNKLDENSIINEINKLS